MDNQEPKEAKAGFVEALDKMRCDSFSTHPAEVAMSWMGSDIFLSSLCCSDTGAT